jgi:hypothetical protein
MRAQPRQVLVVTAARQRQTRLEHNGRSPACGPSRFRQFTFSRAAIPPASQNQPRNWTLSAELALFPVEKTTGKVRTLSGPKPGLLAAQPSLQTLLTSAACARVHAGHDADLREDADREDYHP